MEYVVSDVLYNLEREGAYKVHHAFAVGGGDVLISSIRNKCPSSNALMVYLTAQLLNPKKYSIKVFRESRIINPHLGSNTPLPPPPY
jgi:hypothetical protein